MDGTTPKEHPMPLNATDLAALSRLLDQAMELDGTERNAWIAGLPEEDQHLAPMLREMLAERDSARTSGFLSSMPELADVGTTDEETAATGDLVGPYRLIRQIGRGGMGTVWLVERADGSFKRLVALKLPRLAWGAGLAERMAREREIGALLEHPNIARLYDAGVDDRGRPFLALEYIDGVQIDVWCKDKDLSVRDRLTLIVQVARAVSYAHGRLVVHRDLKPSNVLISLDGQTHLLDFGIAKLINEASPDERGLTQEQGRVLTPHFASPEQLRGEAITVQSDVYSLGVLTYELLTGRTPYKPTRGTLAALEEAVLEGEPALASSRAAHKGVAKALRGEVDTILAKALRREPGQRYATADAFADDIERHLTGERVLAQPDSFSYRLSKTLRRHRFVFAASFAVVLVVVLGSALSIVQAQRVSRAAERQRLVTNFVADVFRINYRTDSTASQVADLTGDRLLQEGAKLIAQRFPGDPALQADLYGVVGRMFLDMGAADQAVDYGTRQVEALDLASSDNYVRAAALTNLAQALADRGRHADAELRAQHAVELAAGNLPLQANAMAVLAQSFTFRGKNDEALATIEQLEPLTQKIGKETAAEAWMYGLRGNLMSRMNQHADSGPLFDRGIAIALRVDGELSSVASDLRYLRASLMCQNGEAKLARQISDASVRALRARGGPSAILAADRAGYFAREYFSCDVMSYAEAIETITRGQAFLQTQPSAPDSIRRQLDFYRGAIELERGNLGEAER